MRVRALRDSDIPILQQIALSAGYPYPDLTSEHIEAVRVVVDDEDCPIMAVAIERILQAYLWCSPDLKSPLPKVYALRLLHEDIGVILRAKGYNGVEAFLPPSLAQRFARRLERTFGWTRNWPSWNKGV